MTGFQQNHTYRISNAFDGSVMDLQNAKTANKNPICSWHNNGHEAQTWIANQESTGFRLVSPLNAKNVGMRAMEQHKDGTLLYMDFHGGPSQQWRAVHVSENKYQILNCQNETAIRNMGCGQKLKCTPADMNDVSQLWILQKA